MQFIRDHLFLIENLIVISLFCTYFFLETKVPPLKRAINGLLLVLIFGIPIFFTSITRSVFEVNKLLLLRFTSILIIMFWSVKSLLVDYGAKNADPAHAGKEFYSIFGLKWYKTGLEIPLLIWLVVNMVSTMLSKNIYVSIIGAYDRWEGIITVVNYAILILIFAKCVDSLRFFYWIFFSFIGSASLSAIYGIFQSNGLDFMQWSADGASRAFGSINNPVHYGPFIGMMILLSFGYMIQVRFFKEKMPPIRFHLLNYVSFVLTLIIYYAMFTSWGRGTWLGFQGALTVFLLFMINVFNSSSKKAYFVDFIFTIGIIALTYIMLLFDVYTIKPFITIPFVVVVVVAYLFWVIKVKDILSFVERVVIIFLAYEIQLVVSGIGHFLLYLGLLAVLVFLNYKRYKSESIFVQNKLIVVVLFSFGMILFAPTIADFIIYQIFLLVGYVGLILRKYIKDKALFKVIVVIFVILFAVIAFPHYSLTKRIGSVVVAKDANRDSLKVLETAKAKTGSYKSAAIQGNPRMSMWKSGIKWGLKNPFFGTGPDTIKEMYPFYRRVEYARLEGGHNLTPDRLHNEYVNTLATTGVTGFMVRYVLVFGTYLYLIINYLYLNRKNPSFFLILSTLGGVIFYQGQVLFNFGVVATASLNYMLMGLGLAIGYYHLGNKYER